MQRSKSANDLSNLALDNIIGDNDGDNVAIIGEIKSPEVNVKINEIVFDSCLKKRLSNIDPVVRNADIQLSDGSSENQIHDDKDHNDIFYSNSDIEQI